MLNYMPFCLGLFFIFVGFIFGLISCEGFKFYQKIKIKNVLFYSIFYAIYSVVILCVATFFISLM